MNNEICKTSRTNSMNTFPAIFTSATALLTKTHTSRYHIHSMVKHGRFCLFLLCTIVSTAYSSSSLEAQRYQNLPSTVFSPSGRLHKVEQNAQSISDIHDVSSPLSLALHCCKKDGDGKENGFVLILSNRPISPHLHLTRAEKSSEDELKESSESEKNEKKNDSYYAPLYLPHIPNREQTPFLSKSTSTYSNSLSPYVSIVGSSFVALTGGNAMDSIILLQRVKDMVISMIRATTTTYSDTSHGNLISTGILARRVADAAQVSTQTLGGRTGSMLKVRKDKLIHNVIHKHFCVDIHIF